MKRLKYRWRILIIFSIILLLCAIGIVYGKDKIIVFGNRPLHVSRLDVFIENTNKSKSDKISIISITGLTNINSVTLSVNEDKIISLSSGDFSDKCRAISKTNSYKETIYSMTSLEKHSAYILLQYQN